MAKTVISDKFQVVIPKLIREKLNLRRGQQLQAYAVDGGVLLSPAKKWPDDYLGSQKRLWESVDIDSYLDEERAAW